MEDSLVEDMVKKIVGDRVCGHMQLKESTGQGP